MKMFRCDRCGKIIEHSRGEATFYVNSTHGKDLIRTPHYVQIQHKDLCEGCRASLKRLMEEWWVGTGTFGSSSSSWEV